MIIFRKFVTIYDISMYRFVYCFLSVKTCRNPTVLCKLCISTTQPDRHGRVFLIPCQKWLVQWSTRNTLSCVAGRPDIWLTTPGYITPGLRRKFAVSVDDLKHIGYCVNGYTTPVRKWWLNMHHFGSRLSVLDTLTLPLKIPVCCGNNHTTV